ncbi:MAG TPA: hypothetical protein VGR62_04175 [Candidatus Binatia bacterium]|jgi:hypothetical protein|nr:hypothetical protein [Candidatus Binatia bacterium]
MRSTTWFATTLALLAAALPAHAAVTAAPGWFAYAIPTPGAVQGAVVRSGDAILVGQGAFGAGAEQVIRLDGGVPTTIATGFNSLGGFALAANGTLYVVDNGGNLPGAATGDTVFAIPNALTRTIALPALGAEVVAAGSIPFAQDVAIDGADLIVSDGTGPGAGRVVRVSGGVVTNLITGLDYTAGVVIDGTRLIVGNVDGTFVGSLKSYTLAGAFSANVATGLSGTYAHVVDDDGNVLSSGGFRNDFSSSNVIAVAPGGGISERAWGFSFSSEMFHDSVRNETLVLDVAVSEITAICRDTDADAICDADDPCLGGAVIAKSKLTLTKVGAPGGDDGLKLSGEMTIPTVPAINPLANGARIVVTDTAGTVADVTIPGGAGWKANGSGTAFSFTSKTGIAGITKVTVKTRPSAPGLVKLGVTGKKGTFATTPANLPLVATFALDVDGQCGVADFTGPTPICAFSGSGTTVKCK